MPPFDDLEYGATLRGLAPGQRMFGRFELVRILGRGGMGVVWLARDTQLDEDVALKFLPDELLGDAGAMEELKRETRRSRSLTHQNVVRIHDFFQEGRVAGISMEYVDGDTLSNLRYQEDRRCFEVAEIREWMRQICEALSYAHEEAKIAHRDLKPANLMVTRKGKAKVTDFGISSSIQESASRMTARPTSGTLVYMSPQQLMGEAPSASDDVYALGATLYDLLTGKPPFYTGNVDLQIREKVPVRMSARREQLEIRGMQGIPEEWEATMAACLAKEAEQRPKSVREVALRLGLSGAGMGGAAVAAGGGSAALEKSGAFWGKVVLALFVVGAVVGMFGMELLRLEEKRKQELAEESERAENEKRLADEAGVKRLTETWKKKADEEERLRVAAERKAAEEMRSAVKTEAKRVEELKRLEEARLSGFVLIPEGSFQMGSKEEGDAPVHTVSVSGFLMGETEVTYGEWKRVLAWAKANGYDFKNSGKGDSEKHPVMDINWYDAVKWSNAKSEKEGLLPCYKVNGSVYRKGENNGVRCEWNASGYRLPTEAEWEKAARGKFSGKQYPNGDKLTKADANIDGSATKVVKSYEPNGYGLYDMAGNVLEWCWDWYAKGYAGSKDPKGPDAGSGRVMRGGGWFSIVSSARCAQRDIHVDPSHAGGDAGFRLVRGRP